MAGRQFFLFEGGGGGRVGVGSKLNKEAICRY